MKVLKSIHGEDIQVSDKDWLFLVGYNWGMHGGYPRCTFRDTFNGHPTHGKDMHWFVAQLMGLEIPKGMTIDHIDRDKLNNQRSNLRAASQRLQTYNMCKRSSNTSGYAGVLFRKDGRLNPWVATILLPNDIRVSLGHYSTPEEASEVYQAAKKIRDKKEEQRCKDQYIIQFKMVETVQRILCF